MSVQAVAFVLYELDPAEVDVVERMILVVIADHAHPDGTTAFPSVDTICNAVGVSRATVHRRLPLLLERGLIAKGDQSYTAHIQANRRPVVYDIPGVSRGLNRGLSVRPQEESGVSNPASGVSKTASRGLTGETQPHRTQELRRAREGVTVECCTRCGLRVRHDDGMAAAHQRPDDRSLCHGPAGPRSLDAETYKAQARAAIKNAKPQRDWTKT